MHPIELGSRATDTVTRFTGEVTSICYNLSGSTLVLLEKLLDSGELVTHWFELERLSQI